MYKPRGLSSSSSSSYSVPDQSQQPLRSKAQRLLRMSWAWVSGSRRASLGTLVLSLPQRCVAQVRRNLTSRRVLSFPHLIVLFWIVILMWGERWVFESKAKQCDWEKWENWPHGSTPHHLIFVADPQITDPHSYPGRPWPLNPLTIMITDNYLRRGYGALQSQLRPDSIFFLGDLFDGGREWKTRRGDFVDPKWGQERSQEEKPWVETWHKKYGEDYWMKEYARFGSIFFDRWSRGSGQPGPYQRGRKLVASLPGNHDLGFGAQVQVAVRDRFSAYFGDVNRVDVVGNHTIVSVDTVSLSADTSSFQDAHDLRPIYGPANQFLEAVQLTKRKAALRELEFWHGAKQDRRYGHIVEELDESESGRAQPDTDPGSKAPDFPTILLTHVPLYREPGTPCGKQREHWPPTKPPKGQTEPVNPDPRNAIPVVAGYQYQNVLSEEDSVKLIKSIGNVKHVFSGDDHDYCEIVHSSAKENVREITVKSLSMVMSVANPGFVMVSLYNPIDADGASTAGSSQPTLQTHLCLLPNQLHTYKRYITFFIVSLVLFSIRAYLVPVLNLTPFALEPESPHHAAAPGPGLPTYKDKVDPPDVRSSAAPIAMAGSSATGFPSPPRSTSSGLNSSGRWSSSAKKPSMVRKGWNIADAGPRIDLGSHNLYHADRRDWKAGTGRVLLGVVGREMLTTSWRCVWMVILFWAYLNRNG